MKLIKLYSHQALITETSEALIDLAAFLEIPAAINMCDDHIFILNSEKEDLSLSSFFIRRTTEVFVPNEVFFEILLDIKAGMSVREAYNKQGYTFN